MKNTNKYQTQVYNLIELILYIHNFPYCGIEEVISACKISRATFYRMLLYVKCFGVVIEFLDTRNKKGYVLLDYGILDQKKINSFQQKIYR